MSALGQKQTFALRNAMSALPPIADMCSATTRPLCATSGHRAVSFDHLVRAGLSGAWREAARQAPCQSPWGQFVDAPLEASGRARCPNGPAGIFPPV